MDSLSTSVCHLCWKKGVINLRMCNLQPRINVHGSYLQVCPNEAFGHSQQHSCQVTEYKNQSKTIIITQLSDVHESTMTFQTCRIPISDIQPLIFFAKSLIFKSWTNSQKGTWCNLHLHFRHPGPSLPACLEGCLRFSAAAEMAIKDEEPDGLDRYTDSCNEKSITVGMHFQVKMMVKVHCSCLFQRKQSIFLCYIYCFRNSLPPNK